MNKISKISWIWLLVAGLSIAFVIMLLYLLRSIAAPVLAPDQQIKPGLIQKEKRSAKFAFYHLLPEADHASKVPKHLQKKRSSQAAQSPEKKQPNDQQDVLNKPQHYPLCVQVASFRKLSDAEVYRAQLLLNGFTRIMMHAVQVDDQQYHRILLGPYQSEQDFLAAKSMLKKIDSAMLIRHQGCHNTVNK